MEEVLMPFGGVVCPNMSYLPTAAQNNTVIYMIGLNAVGDNRGGFFYYRPDSVATVDNMNVLGVPNNGVGRFIRANVKNVALPHGQLSYIGNLKVFFSTASYLTDANSKASINLTLENTSGGTAIFNEIWWNSSRTLSVAATTNDIVLSQVSALSADLKNTTHLFARGSSTTLGSTLLSIGGLIIPGLRNVTTGTPVQFMVMGI